MKITVSSPAKLHLMGEHAVVYGKPAILAATSKRLYVTVVKSQISNLKSQSHNFNLKSLRKEREKDRYLGQIVNIVEKHYKTKISDCYFSVKSDIPTGCGMGSSAAFTVSTIGALTVILKKPWDISVINKLSFAAEKKMHGNPSGGDNTIVSYGGILWFRREFEFLKTFWSLPIKIPKKFAPFVLVNTGKPIESTKEMVELVTVNHELRTMNLESIFNQMEKETKKFLQAVHDENEKEMREAIKTGERLLERLGVVSKEAKKFIRAIEKSGGVAKISGAGGVKKGSGIVICQHKDPETIYTLAREAGYDVFEVRLGEGGVRREIKS